MRSEVKSLILISIFGALTAIGAFIKIPIPFVPFTLQFLFSAFAGILLGSKLGAMSQLLYITIGLIGIPVFTEGGGLGYIFRPTFGYLIGFIFASYIIGKLTENMKKISFMKFLLATLSGLFVVYLIGVPYLYLIYNFYLGQAQTINWTVYYGFIICIGGDIVLTIIIATISYKVVPILKSSGINL